MTARHQQVADELRRRISEGEMEIGEPLPSESEIANEFGVSRGTVRQAVGALRSEGLIAGGRGAPPVVRTNALPASFEALQSFSAWAVEAGHEPGQHTIEVARRRPESAAADALGLTENDVAVEVLRVRSLDGRPILVERMTFVESVGRHLFDFDPDTGSIYARLIECGIDIAVARHRFDAVAADSIDAELLGIPLGSPLLRERRRTTTPDGVPAEYADDRYLPDAVNFAIENTRRGDDVPGGSWHRDAVLDPTWRNS
ncbi:GntR family transcriptional regulator [Ilumatobacter nonamiensis]|uniref:GntR family transcriptional regulator n=1 Tax=Ilumatobacter nonamiensis TaxID=467093 RepID=UPI0003468436|nr:GntR family transcriptional regulator [Ilumatobacter nonamiensis]